MVLFDTLKLLHVVDHLSGGGRISGGRQILQYAIEQADVYIHQPF